jgi:hypothetical protein
VWGSSEVGGGEGGDMDHVDAEGAGLGGDQEETRVNLRAPAPCGSAQGTRQGGGRCMLHFD